MTVYMIYCMSWYTHNMRCSSLSLFMFPGVTLTLLVSSPPTPFLSNCSYNIFFKEMSNMMYYLKLYCTVFSFTCLHHFFPKLLILSPPTMSHRIAKTFMKGEEKHWLALTCLSFSLSHSPSLPLSLSISFSPPLSPFPLCPSSTNRSDTSFSVTEPIWAQLQM